MDNVQVRNHLNPWILNKAFNTTLKIQYLRTNFPMLNIYLKWPISYASIVDKCY